MPEIKNETLAQAQRRTKPKLEDFIATALGDELQQDVLAFLAFCKTKKISYPWSSTNTWTLKAKGKSIGLIWVGDKEPPEQYDYTRWAVGVGFTELHQYDDFIVKENLQSIIWDSLMYCTHCNTYCEPGYTGKILGRTYRNLCRAMYILDGKTCINFENPDTEAIEKAKRIIDFRLALPHGTANRPILDPVTDELTCIDNPLQVNGITDLQGNPILNRITSKSKIENLFDGEYDSYARFWANENSYDIVFQLNEPAELVMYSFVTSFQLQVPDSWKFYGAASQNEPWTLLDEQDEVPKPVTSYTEKAFNIGMPGTYRYYRFSFERCKFDLSQIHLFAQ